MKISILKNDLNEAVQNVARAISSKPTISILSGIKIDATDQGVTLTASDTDISIQSFIPIEKNEKEIITVYDQGSIVLPAKFLVEIVKKLPADSIEIDVNEHFQAWIRSGTSEVQMVGLDPEEYPVLPRLEESRIFTLSGIILKSLIRQTSFACLTTEATPILTGVLWKLENQKLKFTATDRHRLASREVSIDCDPELEFHNIVISGKTLNELSRIIPDQDAFIDIVVADNQVLFKIDSILFYSRILDGTFPDTSRIIPESYKSELVFNRHELTDAIDRAYLLSREDKTNIVRLITKEDGCIEISSSSTELGKVTEQLSASMMEGDPLKISFNSKYMLDVLKAIDNENIYIGFTGAMSPIIIKPHDENQTTYLILPYRTTN